MCVYRPEDKQLYAEYKRLEKMWKERQAELIQDMILSGVKKVYSDDNINSMTLVHMPACTIPTHAREEFDYIRFNWLS